jgi:hypothetical protein
MEGRQSGAVITIVQTTGVSSMGWGLRANARIDAHFTALTEGIHRSTAAGTSRMRKQCEPNSRGDAIALQSLDAITLA